jgi:coproporphyrinogen III oxidase-like Fe-S oxidoreductase
LFYRHPPQVPDDDSAAEMEDLITAMLANAGYDHYETSAYARHERRARHNLNYWTFGDYLGIGAGAHSKLTFPDRIMRQARYRQPREYMERVATGDAIQTDAAVSAADIPFEFMMNALRLNEGFPVALFEERTGLPLVTVLPALDQAERRGFIARDHQHIRPTALGSRFLNDLLEIFMPAGSRAAAATLARA